MSKHDTKLQAALTRLASMFEYGNLIMSATPVDFIYLVCSELEQLREKVKLLEKDEIIK
jgi:hypothetical protein